MPGHLQLAPGVRVVRRGADLLQVGMYDGRRVVLPRKPAVLETLTRLELGLPLAAPVPREVDLDRLLELGLVSGPPAAPSGRVGVVGRLPGISVHSALSRSGLTVQDGDPEVVLVLSQGELSREEIDPLVRSATAHLVLRLVDGSAVLGPFTVPGQGACLRCIDAHHAVADPDHVAVLARYIRAGGRTRADGSADPVEGTLVQLAVAWAVRDVVAFLTGGRPATWSRTVLLGPGAAYRREEEWPRHPTCGCSWGVTDQMSGTMEG